MTETTESDNQQDPNVTQGMPEQIANGQNGDHTDIYIALALLLVLFAGLLWFAFTYQKGTMSAVLVLSGIIGVAFGWIIGIVASPYTAGEKSAFSEFAKLIYGFVSGYVLSKLDPLISKFLDPKASYGFDPQLTAIVFFAIPTFLITVGVTYISRSYWGNGRRGH